MNCLKLSASTALIFLFLLLPVFLAAQFDRQDTLRGSVTPERAWWDLTYYHLDIEVDPAKRTIEGRNTVQYRVLEPGKRMQVDLQPPMALRGAVQNGQPLEYSRDGNVYYIQMPQSLKAGQVYELVLEYGGKPRVAVRAPWDGGLSWDEDENGNPFVATSCQGEGASLWWPCKDHMYDEPDSMLISVRVPDTLVEVSNGKLLSVEKNEDGTHTFHWYVDNPINNYGVNVNIGDYVHWSETYAGEKGALDCNYYVLRGNLDKAKSQFRQVPMMLEAFEHWFGPYPFYEDGFKLVEVPYLGMEHQSSVTYGNKYQNGYLGMDLSGTGWGQKFDFIIIHEAGHEWFANNITYKDIADMWVHEGFTAYSENLYLDYHYGSEASADYVIGTRKAIMNDRPVIGDYDVNHAGSSDMYYKGANMLHTIRTLLGDDEKWRSILRGLNKDFYHQTVTTKQIEEYLIEKSGLDLQPVFDQYLRDTRIPVLACKWEKGKLSYRWEQTISGFDMPVTLLHKGEPVVLKPDTEWQRINLKRTDDLKVQRDYYVRLQIKD
ncbi:M1 family metallopeptidase [Phaeodactylibacter xiamenensis]|uniref:M1 family metallopeptidase n=1 Tax=Phaeodactylibacter xiamenensis TaxID=1524460 RepID=UPI0024A8500C|nr:M1 family metallopeptidase [Phaeodactylibacter xiamenensis]